MAEYVLDTSALIAYLLDEPGADAVEDVMFSGEQIFAPFMAVMEAEYRLIRQFAGRVDQQMSILFSWPMQIPQSTPEWGRLAARVKAPGKLSLGDAWVAALALLRDAELVHKDPEFDAVAGLKALRLPYTPSGRSRS